MIEWFVLAIVVLATITIGIEPEGEVESWEDEGPWEGYKRIGQGIRR